MSERYTVSAENGSMKGMGFDRKGLAFAYARRHARNPEVGRMVVQRDVGEGTSWKAWDAWTFEADGSYDHRRL